MALSGIISGVGGETPFIEQARQRKRSEAFENLDAQIAIENALQNRRRTGIQEEGVQARLAALQRLLTKDTEWKPVAGTMKQLRDGSWVQNYFNASTNETETRPMEAPPGKDFATPGDIATDKAGAKARAYQIMQQAGADQETLDRFWPPADRIRYFSTQDAGIVGLHTDPNAAAGQPGGIVTGHSGYPPGYGGGTPPQDPNLDPTDLYYVDQLADNKMTEDMLSKAYTGRNEYKRRLIIAEAMKRGFNPNAPLTAAAGRDVASAQAQLDINKPLIAEIDRLGLARNNTNGYLAWSRLKYGAGKDTPGGLGSNIANLQLTGITSAAAAMKGASRAWRALDLALQHTPNVWVDSPMLIRNKLMNINARLQDVIDEQKMYGTKSGLPNPPDNQLPPDRIQVPPPRLP